MHYRDRKGVYVVTGDRVEDGVCEVPCMTSMPADSQIHDRLIYEHALFLTRRSPPARHGHSVKVAAQHAA
jgi:hypothetical protein